MYLCFYNSPPFQTIHSVLTARIEYMTAVNAMRDARRKLLNSYTASLKLLVDGLEEENRGGLGLLWLLIWLTFCNLWSYFIRLEIVTYARSCVQKTVVQPAPVQMMVDENVYEWVLFCQFVDVKFELLLYRNIYFQ